MIYLCRCRTGMVIKMKRIVTGLLSCLFLVAIIVAFILFALPNMVIKPYHKEQTYIITSEDSDNYILEMHNNGTMTLYQYVLSPDQSGKTSAYGYKTNYTYHGYYYNPIIWNLHYLPDDHLAFWNKFAFYDNTEERAQLTLTVESKQRLNLPTNDSIQGSYRVTLIEKDEQFILGDLAFKPASTIDSLMINAIKNDFAQNGNQGS